MAELQPSQSPLPATRAIPHISDSPAWRSATVQLSNPSGASTTRLLLVDALRALSASIITWHHFALYWPNAVVEASILDKLLFGLKHYARATPVFFVISGFVLARSLTHRDWNAERYWRFAVDRYCRLALPYLVAMALAIGACAIGRGWLPERVVGPPPTIGQVVAHVFLVEYILGYVGLSAGFWFVCISFQLGLCYAAMLFLRDLLARVSGRLTRANVDRIPILLGWAIAAASLFYFNLHESWDAWAVYFFGYFFLGVLVHEALGSPRSEMLLGGFCFMVLAALAYQWRWRLATSLLTALLLFFGGKSHLLESWPSGRVVRYLGRTSYSLFLIHFPVLVVVATLWVRLNLVTPWESVCGLIVAYLTSLAAAAVFYQFVEAPTARLVMKK